VVGLDPRWQSLPRIKFAGTFPSAPDKPPAPSTPARLLLILLLPSECSTVVATLVFRFCQTQVALVVRTALVRPARMAAGKTIYQLTGTERNFGWSYVDSQ